MSLIVCSCCFILEGESRQLWGLLQWGKPFCTGAVSKSTSTPQKPPCVLASVLSFLIAHPAHWPSSSPGQILNGTSQQGSSSPGHPLRGRAERGRAVRAEGVFSVPLGSPWGFQIFPPRSVLAEHERIWVVGAEGSQEVTACRYRPAESTFLFSGLEQQVVDKGAVVTFLVRGCNSTSAGRDQRCWVAERRERSTPYCFCWKIRKREILEGLLQNF